jgi:hypothetical protein
LNILIILLSLNVIDVFAHGENQAIIGFPLILYFLVLPPFIGYLDYRKLLNKYSSKVIAKRLIWLQNYIVLIFVYLIFTGIVNKWENLPDYLSFSIFFIIVLFFQIFVKSTLYRLFNTNGTITISNIIKTIYLNNIFFIVGVAVLSFLLKILME